MYSTSFLHYVFHRTADVSKLVTREDSYHLHKTLGVISLLNFVYRYAYVYPMTGTLGFDGRLVDWNVMAIHTLLAVSASSFKVQSKRIKTKPLIIYEEYRQHAIVFTLRCFVVFAAASRECQWWVSPVVVAAMHLYADQITRKHGTQGNTAVRSTTELMDQSSSYRYIAKGYSFYQFLAIASHVLPNDRLADLGFNALIAIQSSAFLMTLYRKRIIRGTAHRVGYTLCLLLSTFHIVRLVGWQVVWLAAVVFKLRTGFGLNKYAIWASFVVVHRYTPLVCFV